ncbi:MAG TPA: hypothetical protein VIH42_11075 [Thermoguttaceae bacterium]
MLTDYLKELMMGEFDEVYETTRLHAATDAVTREQTALSSPFARWWADFCPRIPMVHSLKVIAMKSWDASQSHRGESHAIQLANDFYAKHGAGADEDYDGISQTLKKAEEVHKDVQFRGWGSGIAEPAD